MVLRKATELDELEIGKVAFVDAGAGEGVVIALVKARGGSEVKKLTIEAILKALEGSKTLTLEKLRKCKEDFAKERALEEILTELDPEDVKVVLMAIQQATTTPKPETEPTKPPVMAGEHAAPAPPQAPPAMPEEQKKALEKRAADAETKAAEAIKKAEEAIEKANRVFEEARFEKAKHLAVTDDYKWAPLSTTKLAKRLMGIEDLEKAGKKDEAKEERDFLISLSRAVLKSRALETFGSAEEGTENEPDKPRSATEELMRKARARATEIQKSDTKLKPQMALARAIKEVAAENPGLYEKSDEDHMDRAARRRR